MRCERRPYMSKVVSRNLSCLSCFARFFVVRATAFVRCKSALSGAFSVKGLEAKPNSSGALSGLSSRCGREILQKGRMVQVFFSLSKNRGGSILSGQRRASHKRQNNGHENIR